MRSLGTSREALKGAHAGVAPDEYLLLEDACDAKAPERWTAIKSMRFSDAGIISVVREYFLRFLGQRITAEELRYLAGNKSDWTVGVTHMVSSGCVLDGADLSGLDVPSGIFVLRS